MARVVKTPLQRAREALEVASRRVERLEKEEAELSAAHSKVDAELQVARRRRDYAAANPDLEVPAPLPGIEEEPPADAPKRAKKATS